MCFDIKIIKWNCIKRKKYLEVIIVSYYKIITSVLQSADIKKQNALIEDELADQFMIF